MDAAQKLEILCDKTAARHRVASGIVAGIGDRLGTWRIVVHERHGGTCWEIRVTPPGGQERHFVFLGERKNVRAVQETLERELLAAEPVHAE